MPWSPAATRWRSAAEGARSSDTRAAPGTAAAPCEALYQSQAAPAAIAAIGITTTASRTTTPRPRATPDGSGVSSAAGGSGEEDAMMVRSSSPCRWLVLRAALVTPAGQAYHDIRRPGCQPRGG